MQEPFFGAIDSRRPQIAEDAFIAPAAVVVGRVRVGARSSVWYGSVLRGDDEEIIIGEDSNMQDLSVMHADPGYPAVLGDRVTVGHRAIVHGATVEDDVLIGMGAIVLNGARIGPGCLVAAGAIVRESAQIPPDSLVAGVPAAVRREVTAAERARMRAGNELYHTLAAAHAAAVSEGSTGDG